MSIPEHFRVEYRSSGYVPRDRSYVEMLVWQWYAACYAASHGYTEPGLRDCERVRDRLLGAFATVLNAVRAVKEEGSGVTARTL